MSTTEAPTPSEVRIALGLTAALLFFVVLLSLKLANPRRIDFTTLYAGGLIIHQGNASRLYDLGEQARIERQLLNGERFLVNPHPPFEALWFAALGSLSYIKAYILWGAINVVLWLVIQHLLRPHVPVPRHPFHYLMLCSLFFPLWVSLMRGQTAVLLLLLFSLTFVCLKRGQDFRAGIFLGLGLIKFAIVLPFAIICLLRSKWRLMTGFAAAASLLGLLSVIAVGPSGVSSYVNLLIDIVRNPNNPAYGESFIAWGMPTIGGFFSTLLNGHLASVYVSSLALTISACLTLFAAWQWRRQDRDQADCSAGPMFGAALTVSLVTAPHLYVHDLTVMLLAILLVIASSQWTEDWRGRKILTAAIVILYTPIVYLLLPRWHAVYLLAPVLVVFALAAMSLVRKAELPGN